MLRKGLIKPILTTSRKHLVSVETFCLLFFRHHHVSDGDFLRLQQLQRLDTLEVLDSYYRPNSADPSWVVNEPSPRLLQLISDLQELTNHRVRVITSSHRDPLTCHCV